MRKNVTKINLMRKNWRFWFIVRFKGGGGGLVEEKERELSFSPHTPPLESLLPGYFSRETFYSSNFLVNITFCKSQK